MSWSVPVVLTGSVSLPKCATTSRSNPSDHRKSSGSRKVFGQKYQYTRVAFSLTHTPRHPVHEIHRHRLRKEDAARRARLAVMPTTTSDQGSS